MGLKRHSPREPLGTACTHKWVELKSLLGRLAVVLSFLWAVQARGASFVETGSAGVGHFVGTATLLSNGQVLVAGGGGNPIFENVAAAELYDPTTHAWNFTGPLSIARISHTAVLLPNGKVLVAGGTGDFSTNVTSAELYDPATRSWTNTGSMAVGRFNHQMLLLPNGKVLVAGGFDDAGDPLLSAEIYDPADGVWSSAGSIAGSVITMLDAVRLMLSLGVSEVDAAGMASSNPARLLRLDNECGSIEEGKRADLVALDERGNVRLTMIGGHVAFRASAK